MELTASFGLLSSAPWQTPIAVDLCDMRSKTCPICLAVKRKIAAIVCGASAAALLAAPAIENADLYSQELSLRIAESANGWNALIPDVSEVRLYKSDLRRPPWEVFDYTKRHADLVLSECDWGDFWKFFYKSSEHSENASGKPQEIVIVIVFRTPPKPAVCWLKTFLNGNSYLSFGFEDSVGGFNNELAEYLLQKYGEKLR